MKRTKYDKNQPIGYGIGAGVAVSIITSIVLMLLLTNLVNEQNVNERTAELLLFMIRMISVLVGAVIGMKLTAGKGLLIIGTVLVGYMLFLLSVGIIAYDGAFQRMGSGLLSVLIGAAVSCVIALKPQRKSKQSLKYKR